MYIETEHSKEMAIKQPFMESEMRIRMELAFLNMGLKYEKEVKISSHYIDFLLDDKVIL